MDVVDNLEMDWEAVFNATRRPTPFAKSPNSFAPIVIVNTGVNFNTDLNKIERAALEAKERADRWRKAKQLLKKAR